MTFQKYFGKKAKFLVATVMIPVIAILSNSGCQPKYAIEWNCSPQFEAIYTIMLIFIIFSFVVWLGVGLYYLIKFVRSRKISYKRHQ